MNAEQFEKWVKENCTTIKTENFNGLTYKFCTMTDGWIAIFRVNQRNGWYETIIQAKDYEHACRYCTMIEPIPAGVDVI